MRVQGRQVLPEGSLQGMLRRVTGRSHGKDNKGNCGKGGGGNCQERLSLQHSWQEKASDAAWLPVRGGSGARLVEGGERVRK